VREGEGGWKRERDGDVGCESARVVGSGKGGGTGQEDEWDGGGRKVEVCEMRGGEG